MTISMGDLQRGEGVNPQPANHFWAKRGRGRTPLTNQICNLNSWEGPSCFAFVEFTACGTASWCFATLCTAGWSIL